MIHKHQEKIKQAQLENEERQKEIENQLHWLRDLVQVSEDEGEGNAKDYLNTLSHDIFR